MVDWIAELQSLFAYALNPFSQILAFKTEMFISWSIFYHWILLYSRWIHYERNFDLQFEYPNTINTKSISNESINHY